MALSEAEDEFFDVKAPAYLPKEGEAFSIGIEDLATCTGMDKAALQGGETTNALKIFNLRYVASSNMYFGLMAQKISSMKATARALIKDTAALFRNAFWEILEDPETYQKRKDVVPTDEYTGNFKNGIADSGFLTNTFLVFDPVCIDLVVESVYFYDNMRVLAFEAEFPVPGRTYKEGYQGYTWVRLDQLVYYFYNLRLNKADELGMDKIWEAAQKSRNGAFVSMDPEEAMNWSHSCHLTAFTPDSI
ncbi:ea30048a-8284-457a-aae8-770c2968d441 [Sclerotinia trifoliorum]|uniref:Ea30048a-8284-457a-aae8-770c2968d441 n=1 Tax=Sclerotinia trifoliorum TaxID=28548 RepID=A0A8H2VM51_9HELO|nr:ea30048a-8284-457a-aae8-770c2968d441 [Sclerotinia trifoliorum]